jgi:sugar phosphate isomerase/epimerase
LADDFGVKIAVENRLETIFGCRISDLLSIVSAHPDDLGICLDTGHAMVNGISPAVAMRQARGALIATHVHDNDGYSDQHLPPLMGNIDWADFMRAVEDIQYGRPLIVEVPGTHSLKACDNKLLLTKGAIDKGLIGRS